LKELLQATVINRGWHCVFHACFAGEKVKKADEINTLDDLKKMLDMYGK
jgi:hypothetical protein